jgi:hypothetical protein
LHLEHKDLVCLVLLCIPRAPKHPGAQ